MQTLIEERTKNRAEEAVELFESICMSPYFRGTDIILFLNKRDLLREKLEKHSLQETFSSFKGDNTYENAVTFFEDMYTSALERSRRRLLSYGTPNEVFEGKQVYDTEFKDSFARQPGTNSSGLISANQSFQIQEMRDEIRSKQLYTHITNATDQGNIRFAFEACRDIILRDNIKHFLE